MSDDQEKETDEKSKCCSWRWSDLWSWASNYVRFSKGAPFISGLISSKSFLEVAFKAFLISYIRHAWERPSLRRAAAFANGFEAILLFSTIIAHHIARDRLGHFRLILITVPCLIIGLLLLWLTTLLLSSDNSNRILYVALEFLTIGIAGEAASLGPFLYAQFHQTMDKLNNTSNVETRADDELSERQRLDEYESTVDGRANLWSYAAMTIGTFTSWAFTSSLNWKHAFMVTFIVVTAAYSLFCIGCRFYDPNFLTPRTIRNLTTRISQARGLLKLMFLWLVFLPYSLVEAAGNTLFIAQSYGLDAGINPRISVGSFNRIPIASLYVFQTFTSSTISLCCDFLIKKVWSAGREETQRRRARFVRTGIGLLFGVGSCVSAWLVERRRLKLIHRLGINDDDDEGAVVVFIPMKILLLAPQFGLLGIANGLAGKGMRHFFYDHVPNSMDFFALPIILGVLGIGRLVSLVTILLARSWIGDSFYTSHMDKYFLMLASLNFAFLLLFLLLSCICDWSIEDQAPNASGIPPSGEVIHGDVEL